MEYLQDYQNLELNIGASKDEIKTAYKRLSKLYHPDKKNNCDYSEFIKISESYQRLMNVYDYKIEMEDYEFYIENYTNINPQYEEFINFLNDISKVNNILITTGINDLELINRLKNIGIAPKNTPWTILHDIELNSLDFY